jgi:hypothetical protein
MSRNDVPFRLGPLRNDRENRGMLPFVYWQISNANSIAVFVFQTRFMFGQALGDAHVANWRVVRKDKGFSHSSLFPGFYRFQRVNDLKEVVQMADVGDKCSTGLSTLEQMPFEVFFGGRAGEYVGQCESFECYFIRQAQSTRRLSSHFVYVQNTSALFLFLKPNRPSILICLPTLQPNR